MGEGVAMRHTCNRRVEDAEEVGPPRRPPLGGEGLDPSPLSMLCACRQHAGNQHWSHRSRPGGAGAIACASCMVGQTQNARERAHERRWGEVWRVGMGWAAHRKSSIFRCPVSFSELTNPSQLQRPGSPISSWSEKVLPRLAGTP